MPLRMRAERVAARMRARRARSSAVSSCSSIPTYKMVTAGGSPLVLLHGTFAETVIKAGRWKESGCSGLAGHAACQPDLPVAVMRCCCSCQHFQNQKMRLRLLCGCWLVGFHAAAAAAAAADAAAATGAAAAGPVHTPHQGPQSPVLLLQLVP